MVVPFDQGCSTCYLMKVSRQASKLLVNCGWLGGEMMSPAILTMEFLRTEKLFSKIKTKIRSLRIWAQLTLSFSNLCPTSSHHQYSLRSNILARLTIGLAFCNDRPRCNYMESRLCLTYLIHISSTNIYTNLSKGHSTDMENDIFGWGYTNCSCGKDWEGWRWLDLLHEERRRCS